MITDELGLEHTTNNTTSAAGYCDALDKYLGSRADTMPAIDDLLSADPGLPMATLFRAYLLKSAADPRFRIPIQQCYESLSKDRDLNDREQMHLNALSIWQSDRLDETAAAFDAIVTKYPKDMLALRISHYLHFYGKGGAAMLESLDNAAGHWTEQDRFFGYLQGMHSFANEESGLYDVAESAGLQALEINKADIWAAHAVTHILQMQQRFSEGVPFIEKLTDEWNGANNFVNHMHWHKALQHIGNGDNEIALKIYDDLLVEPLKDDFYLDVCNAASLLWRLSMHKVDVGDRWEQLMDYSQKRIEDDELVFTTLHYLMAPAILHDEKTVERGLKHFQQWSSSKTTQGEISKSVGSTMAQAIALLGKGEHHEGATLMRGVQKKIQQIGGSHAQRHLFDQLIEHYN